MPFDNVPRAYDLEDRREQRRLIVEVSGYLRTCRSTRCGGDFEGRAFAMDALEDSQPGCGIGSV